MNYTPSHEHVHEARRILQLLKLPNELVLDILEYACYFPAIETQNMNRMSIMDTVWSLESSSARIYLLAPPIPYGGEGENVKVRQVEFEISSQDQGWTTEDTKGTFKTSSWFEVSILRPQPFIARHCTLPLASAGLDEGGFQVPSDSRKKLGDLGWRLCPRSEDGSHQIEPQRIHCSEMVAQDEGTFAWYLQGNKVATPDHLLRLLSGRQFRRDNTARDYRVVWGRSRVGACEVGEGAGEGQGFVDKLREGDVIAVWARAKRRGWENHVERAKITIRYDI